MVLRMRTSPGFPTDIRTRGERKIQLHLGDKTILSRFEARVGYKEEREPVCICEGKYSISTSVLQTILRPIVDILFSSPFPF